MFLTCKRSLWSVNKVICIGICRKAVSAQPPFIRRSILSCSRYNVYINDIDISIPFMQQHHRNILYRIFWDFVALTGSGQQQANVRSTFRKARTFSSVNISVIIKSRRLFYRQKIMYLITTQTQLSLQYFSENLWKEKSRKQLKKHILNA